MKKVFIGIGLVFVIIIGGFFVALNMIDPKTIQGKIEKRVQDITGEPFYVAQVPSISFMPLGVSFGAISWGDKKNSAISVAAKGGFVQVQFIPLLSGNIIIDEVQLDSPVVSIAAPKPNAKAQNSAKSETLPELPLELAKLSISNGEFNIQLTANEYVKVSGLNAILSNLKPGAVASLNVDTNIEMANPSLKGKAELLANVLYAPSGINISKLNILYTAQAGVIPAGVGTIDITSDGLDIIIAAIPSIKGKVSVKELKLDAFMTEGETVSSAKPSQKSSTKTVYPKIDVALNIAQVSYADIIIKNVQAHAKGDGGTSTNYDLNPITFDVASGGKANAKSSVQLPSMQVQKSGTLTGLKVDPILTALQGNAALDAMVDMNWELSMNASSGAQIMNSLTGYGKIIAKDIIIKDGVSIPENPIVKSTSFKDFSELNVPFNVKNGHVNIINANLLGQGVTANGGGKIILPSQTLDLKVDASTLGMVVPIIIGGTFNNPSYGVDPKWLTNALINLPSNLVKGGAGATKVVTKGAGGAVKGAGKVGEEAGKLIKGLFGK